MKILTVVGARPQFIKAAPVSRELRKENVEILVHTGQHYDKNMSDIFFQELKIPKPDYNLGVGSGSHGKQTAQMLIKLEDLILNEKPDGVMVYGDTNSTLAGALASSKLHIPVIHVEAGLRSYNKLMPEEQNRVLTDHISDILFCPTDTAVSNLNRENIYRGVYNVGDVMYDSVLYNIKLANSKISFSKLMDSLTIYNEIDYSWNYKLEQLTSGNYILATIHRAENTEGIDKLETIINSINDCKLPVIFPVHPRIKKNVSIALSKIQSNCNILFVEPVGYLQMLALTQNALKVVTDSGGLQKEAYFLKTPCVTLRDQTEWVETLSYGWNTLCSIDKEQIIFNIQSKFEKKNCEQVIAFGDGNAAYKISKIITELKG